MKINEIELYDEDVIDEILSHLSSTDKFKLEQVLKSLCAMVTTRDRHIVDLKEKLSNIKVALEQFSAICKATTNFEKEELEKRRLKEAIAKIESSQLHDEIEQIRSCRIIEWVD